MRNTLLIPDADPGAATPTIEPTTGPDAFELDVVLVEFDGTEETVRGTVARQPRTAGQLVSAFDEGGWQAYIRGRLVGGERVEFARWTHPRTGTVRTHRVLDREVTGAGMGTSTRLQLQDPS